MGRLATDRLRSDFEDELRGAASQLALEIELRPSGSFGDIAYLGPDLDEFAMASDASARIVFSNGEPFDVTPNLPELGMPTPGIEHGENFDVATLPIVNDANVPPAFIQYARSHDELDATIDRLWLLPDLRGHRRHRAGRPGRARGRRPRDAPDRLAHHDRPRDRIDPRPLARIPEPERDDEVGRAGPDAGRDAARARCRARRRRRR